MIGRLTAGLLHDLTTPITAALLHLEKCESLTQCPVLKRSLDSARTAVTTAEKFVTNTRRHCMDRGERQYFCLVAETIGIKQLFEPRLRSMNAVLDITHDTGAYTTLGDPVRWSHIMLNLITNALDAYPSGHSAPSVAIRFGVCDREIICRVTDHGVGIDRDHMSRVFEPFFSTKREGSGIGLCMARYYIKEEFGGTLHIESTRDVGTTCTIRLPKF